MKFSEISKKLGVALLTGAVVVSMAGMNVSAEGVTGSGTTSVTQVPISKTVTTDGDTFAPNTTFNFEVATAAAGEFNDGEQNNVVYGGIDGALLCEGATFVPGESVDKTYTSDTGKLNINASVFEGEAPGVYHYTVNEADTTYEGVTKDSTVYDVYLYVYVNDKGKNYVGNVVTVKRGETNSKADLSFNNDYGDTNDGTHDVTIKKIVTGNQGNAGKPFDFTVKVAGADGEKYKAVKTAKNGTTTEMTLVSDATQAFTLKADETIQIFGLSASDTYEVVETSANTDGYTLSVASTNTEKTQPTEITNGVRGTVLKDAANVEFTNNKNTTTPTGVVMNIAPYALMVALAGVLAFFFLRRRHSEI